MTISWIFPKQLSRRMPRRWGYEICKAIMVAALEQELRDHRTSTLGGVGREAVVETSVWRRASGRKRKMDGTVLPR